MAKKKKKGKIKPIFYMNNADSLARGLVVTFPGECLGAPALILEPVHAV